jgi:hypothetical protein
MYDLLISLTILNYQRENNKESKPGVQVDDHVNYGKWDYQSGGHPNKAGQSKINFWQRKLFYTISSLFLNRG